MTLKHSINYLVATFNNVVEVNDDFQTAFSVRKISFTRGNAIFCEDSAFAWRFMIHFVVGHN